MKGVRRPLPESAWFRSQVDLVSRHFFAAQRGGEEGGFDPLVDVVEGEAALVVQVDLPGVPRGSVQVFLEAGKLVIEGRKAEEETGGRFRFLLVERLSGAFRKVVDLPVPIHPGKAAARLSEGVLTVHLPRVSDKRAVRHEIPVTGEGEVRP